METVWRAEGGPIGHPSWGGWYFASFEEARAVMVDHLHSEAARCFMQAQGDRRLAGHAHGLGCTYKKVARDLAAWTAGIETEEVYFADNGQPQWHSQCGNASYWIDAEEQSMDADAINHAIEQGGW